MVVIWNRKIQDGCQDGIDNQVKSNNGDDVRYKWSRIVYFGVHVMGIVFLKEKGMSIIRIDIIWRMFLVNSQIIVTKLWVCNIIKPIFLMMRFCRASHEGDWPLHIKTAEDMRPCMFAAYKYNYGSRQIWALLRASHGLVQRCWTGSAEMSNHCTTMLVSTMDNGVTCS